MYVQSTEYDQAKGTSMLQIEKCEYLLLRKLYKIC